MFLQASMILLTGGGGVCLSACWDTTTPQKQTPLGADTPGNRHLPEADTPWKQTPLGADTPPEQTLPGADTPPHAEHAGRYGQRAGSTHPTGMQYC